MKTQAIKDKYIKRAEMHQKQDDFIQGFYWENEKGCCVGCLAHVNENAHKKLEEDTGTPEWVYQLSDTLFEGLDAGKAKKFPLKFVKAMPVGLTAQEWDEKVKAPFLVYLLKQSLKNFDHAKFPDVKDAVTSCIKLWQREDIGSDDWQSAAEAAAESAARSAAESAAWSAARSAAESAAWSADSAAESAAWSAESAAESAAWSAAKSAESAAESAAWSAAKSAESAARSAAYDKYATKLLKLMKETAPE